MTDTPHHRKKYDVHVERLEESGFCFRQGCQNVAHYELNYRRRGDEPYRFYQSLCETHLPTKARHQITEPLE